MSDQYDSPGNEEREGEEVDGGEEDDEEEEKYEEGDGATQITMQQE